MSRVRVGADVSAAQLFAALLPAVGGYPVFTADHYVEDVTHPGYVLRFIDHNDPTHYLEQTTTALQVAIPTADSTMRGRLTASFTGSQYYVSNKAASYFSFLNNLSSVFCTFSATSISETTDKIIWETGLSNTTNSASLRQSGRTSLSAITGRNTLNNAIVVPAVFTSPGPICAELYTDVAQGRFVEISGKPVNTVAISAGTQGTCTTTLTLGARSGGTLPFIGKWRSLVMAPNWSARSIAKAWVTADCGARVGKTGLSLTSGVLLMGDSIVGYYDTDYPTAIAGWYRRALYAAGVPYSDQSAPGTLLRDYTPTTRPSFFTAQQLQNYSTVFINYCRNDLGNGRTLVQMQTDMQDVWTAFNNAGLRIYTALVCPFTTSTDAWATEVNQTPGNANEVEGGTKDQLNSWISSQVGIQHDGVFDPQTVIATHRVDGWVWKAARTNDGGHPNPAGHTLMVPVVANLVSSLSW